METTGRLKDASRTFDGKNILITFEVDASAGSQIEEIRSYDMLDIKAVKHRKKRSLDANAYAWVLMTKIAQKQNTTKEEIYELMLQRYGIVYSDDDGYVAITVKSSVDMSKIDGHWKFHRSNGEFTAYLMIKGTSEYDTAEMSYFIDRIVEEAKENGIETATPDEIERMKLEYETYWNKVQKRHT